MKTRYGHKAILTALVTGLLLSAAGTAQAGDRGYRDGLGRFYGFTPARHYRHAPRHHYRSNYRRHHGHRGRHDSRRGLKIAAGALLLGTVIHSIHHDNRRERVVYRTVAPRGGIWYRVDQDGQCVEVSQNRYGQEVWTYVDPSYCY